MIAIIDGLDPTPKVPPTRPFELTSVDRNLRLEFCMLRADSLCAAEADIRE